MPYFLGGNERELKLLAIHNSCARRKFGEAWDEITKFDRSMLPAIKAAFGVEVMEGCVVCKGEVA